MSQQLVATLWRLALVLLALSCHSSEARARLRNNLKIHYNLGCRLKQCVAPEPNSSAVNLFQVISSNSEAPGVTNFIWSTIGGPPMVIATNAKNESALKIDWDTLLSQPTSQDANRTSALYFNKTQDASIGMLLEKIILFNDTDGTGLFLREKPHVEIDWADLVWDSSSKMTYRKDDFLNSAMRLQPRHKYLNGTLIMKLAISRDQRTDRQRDVPHLKLNKESISVDIIVDGLKPPRNFTNTKLAMTFVVVVQSPPGEVKLDTLSESLISDEYSPGVFRLKTLQFETKPEQPPKPSSQLENDDSNPGIYAEDGQGQIITSDPKPVSPSVNNKLGFFYWKEVAYSDSRRTISRTVSVRDSEMKMPFSTLPNISQPFYQFFKLRPADSKSRPDYKLYRFELIYGNADSSYSSTNFTDFSFVFGLGEAPHEQTFSFLVKVVIFVCFCLPLLVMALGLGYLMFKRFHRSSDTERLLAGDS